MPVDAQQQHVGQQGMSAILRLRIIPLKIPQNEGLCNRTPSCCSAGSLLGRLNRRKVGALHSHVTGCMLPAPFDQLRTQVIGLDNFAGRARVTKAALNQRTQLESQVQRWTEAGLIDAQVGTRILAFEAGQERRASLRWPVLFAMVFGGILVFAGITLFVAAHWNELSPGVRFSLVLLMVGAFHVGGAALTDRFPPLSTTLHALGTATLGAAIFLTAQIFNLHEDWAAGVLLWAIGAAVGYILLQDWTQAAAVALLTPAWLISQWIVIAGNHTSSSRPLAFGLILTALCYLSVRIGDQQGTARRTLVWIGGIALLPCVVAAFVLAVTDMELGNTQSPPLGRSLRPDHWCWPGSCVVVACG